MSTSFSRQELYLHQIRISNAVLQFNFSAGRGLTLWKWYYVFWIDRYCPTDRTDRPVNDRGERVTPSDLREHRMSHRFLGPCCICPAITEGRNEFTEAAFVMLTSGPRVGHYVARCASGECKYIGEPMAS
jgi:hypothetical protein